MNHFNLLINRTIQCVNNGHSGLFRVSDIAVLMRKPIDNELRSFISKAVKKGMIKRVAKGIYSNPLSPPDKVTAIYRIVTLLRSRHLNYISLESELSHIGVISQIPINWLTVMTTGRKGVFKTDYGTIEFTHTRGANVTENDLYYDPDKGLFCAKKDRAIRDLKRVGRNVAMIEDFDDDK